MLLCVCFISFLMYLLSYVYVNTNMMLTIHFHLVISCSQLFNVSLYSLIVFYHFPFDQVGVLRDKFSVNNSFIHFLQEQTDAYLFEGH